MAVWDKLITLSEFIGPIVNLLIAVALIKYIIVGGRR